MSYQVSVLYDGKKLIPTATVEFVRDIRRSADGRVRARGWKVTAKGKVSAWKGSPNAAGEFHTGTGYPADDTALNLPEKRLANLRTKLGALSALFAADGRWFEVQPGDGSAPIKFQPRIQGFTYAEGKWFDYVDWVLQMECDCVHFGTVVDPSCEVGDGTPAEESWALEVQDDAQQTYRLTHTVSAQFFNRFLADGSGAVEAYGWQLAQERVAAALGYSAAVATSFGLTGYGAYNKTTAQTRDEAAGRYQATETWTLARQNYVEETTTEATFSAESGLWTVRAAGTITGLQSGTDPAERYTNANARAAAVATEAALLTRAQAESGVTLNPKAATLSTTRNRPAGQVTYSGEFNNRPGVPDGQLSNVVTVSIDQAVPVVAQIGVLNRPAGPVLQDVGSYTQRQATVQFDIAVRVAYGEADPAIPSADPLTEVAKYIGTPPTIYVAADREQWSPKSGRYTRTTSYIYQPV